MEKNAVLTTTIPDGEKDFVRSLTEDLKGDIKGFFEGPSKWLAWGAVAFGSLVLYRRFSRRR